MFACGAKTLAGLEKLLQNKYLTIIRTLFNFTYVSVVPNQQNAQIFTKIWYLHFVYTIWMEAIQVIIIITFAKRSVHLWRLDSPFNRCSAERRFSFIHQIYVLPVLLEKVSTSKLYLQRQNIGLILCRSKFKMDCYSFPVMWSILVFLNY